VSLTTCTIVKVEASQFVFSEREAVMVVMVCLTLLVLWRVWVCNFYFHFVLLLNELFDMELWAIFCRYLCGVYRASTFLLCCQTKVYNCKYSYLLWYFILLYCCPV